MPAVEELPAIITLLGMLLVAGCAGVPAVRDGPDPRQLQQAAELTDSEWEEIMSQVFDGRMRSHYAIVKVFRAGDFVAVHLQSHTAPYEGGPAISFRRVAGRWTKTAEAEWLPPGSIISWRQEASSNCFILNGRENGVEQRAEATRWTRPEICEARSRSCARRRAPHA